MLRSRILPSGIGHTTNCFLQVEGCEGGEAYIVTETMPDERQSVQVGRLFVVPQYYVISTAAASSLLSVAPASLPGYATYGDN